MQCSVPLCENASENVPKFGRITFHGFPSEANLRSAWFRALGKQDSHLPDSAVVCSQHFLHHDIIELESGSRQLRTGAVPSTVLFCMICFETNSKMFLFSQYNLEEAYEKLTGHPLCDGGSLNQTLCVLCAQGLRNFSRFREQSLRARFLMMELLEKHKLITIQHIKMIKHANKQLRNNFVSTTLGPDPCDVYIVENSDEERRTDLKEAVRRITVKTECNDESQCEVEDTQTMNEENADCRKIEITLDPIKYESTQYMSTDCSEEFSHEHVLYRSASEDEVPTTQNEPAASLLSETEPCTSGYISRTRTFTCDICQREFVRNHHLVTHMRSHAGAKVYPCKICGYKFTHKGNLVKHMRIHTGEKPFPCKICDNKFTVKAHLVQHMRKHTGEKPYSCDTCSHKCARKGDLVRHVRIHTGEKPFPCKKCNHKFTVKAQLVQHIMRIHTGEKPYSCETCCYKCTKKDNLVRHMRTHTGEKPYSCNMCSYKFAEKSHLVQHMRIHTGEKPYSCETCSYKCTKKGDLARHARTHTGEKPYSCQICSFKFAEKRSLVNHMSIHTGQKP